MTKAMLFATYLIACKSILIAAVVIGREMKKICLNNTSLNKRIEGILKREVEKNETSLFLRKMQEETATDIEQMRSWLQKVLNGFTQSQYDPT